MDWAMVDNADGPTQRVQTILYLFRERYRCDPKEAAMHLSKERPGNELCDETVRNIQTELASPSANLGLGPLFDDADSRMYLAEMMSTYDQLLGQQKNG
jgi:hypothetical protein